MSLPGGRAPGAVVTTSAIDCELGDDLASAALHLARRFAAGATMWSLAPCWAPHPGFDALFLAPDAARIHPVGR